MFVRGLHLKFKRQSPYFFKWALAIFLLFIVFDKLIIGNGFFRRQSIVVQNDLINYNEDDLRTEWPFQISKHYDARDLRSYTVKHRISPTANSVDLPGEGGFIFCGI